VIHAADRELKRAWGACFANLTPSARASLRQALLALRADALRRAEHQWRRHKAPMALYWKVIGVYAGHLARSLREPASASCLRAAQELQFSDSAKAES
jgi:hypothetical protein